MPDECAMKKITRGHLAAISEILAVHNGEALLRSGKENDTIWIAFE